MVESWPGVGGHAAGPGDSQVVVKAAQTLHDVEEDVVAVVGEQLLDEGEVLPGLEEKDEPVVLARSLQPVADLLQLCTLYICKTYMLFFVSYFGFCTIFLWIFTINKFSPFLKVSIRSE